MSLHPSHIIFGTILLCVPLRANATGWYVDGLNGNQNNTGLAQSPFLYLWQALNSAKPGDTIYIAPTMTYGPLAFMATGTPSGTITLAGADPLHPTHVSGGGKNAGVWISGDYVTLRNFDVTAPGSYPGVSVAPNHHHVAITNNVVHDSGANGITTFSDDYLNINNNIVYNNAKNTTQSFNSGISVLGSVDIDTNTGYKITIAGNFVYANTNVPTCSTSACYAAARDSDGNGIILDDNQRQQFDQKPYKGAFLIQNNVVYRNGGRGVHIYRSDHVTVTGNTLWENNQDPYEDFWHPGEVSGLSAGKIGVYNNILYSDGRTSPNHTGTAPNTHVMVSFEFCTDGAGTITVQNNIGYNALGNMTLAAYTQGNTNAVLSIANQIVDPQLEDPAHGDFRFKPASPAYHIAGPHAPSLDILGVARAPISSIGAYQNPGP